MLAVTEIIYWANFEQIQMCKVMRLLQKHYCKFNFWNVSAMSLHFLQTNHFLRQRMNPFFEE